VPRGGGGRGGGGRGGGGGGGGGRRWPGRGGRGGGGWGGPWGGPWGYPYAAEFPVEIVERSYGPSLDDAVDALRAHVGKLGITGVGRGETQGPGGVQDAVVVYVAGAQAVAAQAARALPAAVMGYPVVVRQVQSAGLV
jgi:hypothetical protein